MKKSLMRLALGTTALVLLMSGQALADPLSDVTFDDELWEGDETGDESGLDFDNGLGATGFTLIETERESGRFLGDFQIPSNFASTPRISYDSNICENYGSNTFSLPQSPNDYYDQRFVDEAKGYLDNMSDQQFLEFMDWLWFEGPEPLALRGSNMDEALDIIDWMTGAEIVELVDLTAARDERLLERREAGNKIGFSGIFATALMANQLFFTAGPRATNIEGGMTRIPPPTVQFTHPLSGDSIRSIMDYITPAGGVIVPPASETVNGWQIKIPYDSAYGLDRLRIRADYNLGIENKIADGSVPTITFDPDSSTPSSGEDEQGIYLDPSALKFYYEFQGGMTEIDPPTLDLTSGDDGPIESVIPELSGGPGSTTTEIPFDWDTITPRIGLSYDLGGGLGLTIPLGKYDQNTTETPATTTTERDPPGTIYSSNIKFKIEESIFEGDQSSIQPAEETVVKLGFPIPPMPLDGNPRIDEGASDNPVQGQVDSDGNLNLRYDFKDNFGLGLRAEYDYGSIVWPVENDTQVGDGSPPTLTLDEPTDTIVERSGVDVGNGADTWTAPVEMIALNLSFGGGNVRIDPPTLDLSAGPSDAPIESVIPELQPYSLTPQPEPAKSTGDSTQGGDSRLQDRQSDINWQEVQNALGEFADIPALDRMRNRDQQHEGGEPSTDSTGQDTLRYNTPSIGPVRIGSGIRGTSSDVDLDINMNPIGSKILFSDNPLDGFAWLNPFSPRYLELRNEALTAIFFPLSEEPKINTLIESTPEIKRADPNPYRDKQGDDPYFSSEGSWGQDYADQWAIQRVGFTGDEASAWAAAGDDLAPVIVAVIDSGIDWNHADISWDIIWNNEDEIPGNGIDDDQNGYIDDVIGWDFFLNTNLPWDEDGHGTFVAGLIAAESDNGTGISGINPAAKIMVLKALDSFGHTRASYLVEAIVYAVDNGAQIINLSVGGKDVSHAEELAVQYAEDHGVLIFAAAGNQGAEVSDYGFVPYETVVAVGSSNIEDKRSGFSNWGEGIDISAPGEDVLSLRARRTDLMLNVRHLEYEMGTAYVGEDNRYYRAAGTSFSTPIVTGIASLILSKNPDLTPVEVRRMLFQSAKDIEVPGRDQYTGFGRVDATAALNADPAFEIVADIVAVEVVQESGGVFVAVNGTASANDFDRAQIFIGTGENPDDWKAVGEGIKRAVSGGRLDRIQAAEFQGAPVWIIRLVVTHENGKVREERYTLNLN